MSRAKLLFVACFAVFAFSAVTVTSALASEWDVEGKALGGSAALAATALVLTNGKLTVPEANTEIECKGHELLIKGGKIISPDFVLSEGLTFDGCTTNNTGGCSVATTISTLPIHGLAHLDGTSNVLILVLPETKTTFAAVTFTGTTCALEGTQPVTGTADLLVHEGQVSGVLHRVLAFSLTGKLKVGGDTANLIGVSGEIGLASGKPWNFL